jgi:hypothetical protein
LQVHTVKPVYNGHAWDLKKVAVWQRCLIKLRFRLVVDDSNWPLLLGGRCSQVVVKSGLTVYINYIIYIILQVRIYIYIIYYIAKYVYIYYIIYIILQNTYIYIIYIILQVCIYKLRNIYFRGQTKTSNLYRNFWTVIAKNRNLSLNTVI